MRTLKRLVAPLLLALFPMVAYGSGGEEGLSTLVSIAPGSILWTILTFLLLLFILGKFAWGPIVRGLEAREEKIYGAIDEAQKDREEAEKLLADYQKKLSEASSEIADRLSKADKQARDTIEQAKADAQVQAEQMLERAKAEIDGQRDKVAAELKTQVVELSAEIAAAAIGEAFDKPQHLELIRKRLEQAEKSS